MHRDLIVIGASAGGIETLQKLLAALPGDLEAAVLIVLHTGPASVLPQILRRSSNLPASHPADGTLVRKGQIYIAPPDFHMLLEGNHLRVLHGPRENLHRPAIDPLFRSAAVSAGRRVIGVVLTGMLDDGTSGLMVIRAHGGAAIVEDPRTALFPAMPSNALRQVPDAQVLPIERIPAELVHLTTEELPDGPKAEASATSVEAKETEFLELEVPQMPDDVRPGHPSAFACPDCGGVLWELEEKSGFLRFRCRVGHAFTLDHLDAEQRHAVETALWSALRALEESAALYRRMGERAGGARQTSAARFIERANNKEANAQVLRDFLVHVNAGEQEEITMV